MATIKQVIRMVNKGAEAIVEVQLDHGGTGVIYIGGQVEEYYHHGKVKVFVIKGRPPIDN